MCITIKHRFACCAIKQNKQNLKTALKKSNHLLLKKTNKLNPKHCFCLSISLCVQVKQADFYSMPKVKGRLTISSFPLATSLGYQHFHLQFPKIPP